MAPGPSIDGAPRVTRLRTRLLSPHGALCFDEGGTDIEPFGNVALRMRSASPACAIFLCDPRIGGGHGLRSFLADSAALPIRT